MSRRSPRACNRTQLTILVTLILFASFVEHAPRAENGYALPFPVVLVSRQIPDRGSIAWEVPRAQPGVGGHSRFRPAAPGRLLLRHTDGTIRTLIDGRTPGPSTLQLIDVNAPDVSYDGRWIAFAGLRRGTYADGPGAHPGAWRIYVIRVNGTGLRQVTPDEQKRPDAGTGSAIGGQGDGQGDGLRGHDDTDPAWLPDGRLVFASTRWPAFAQYGGLRTTNLHVIDVRGGGLRRITAERNGAERPLIDPITGKIVYARWWRSHRYPLDDERAVADPRGGYVQKDGLSADRRLQMTGAPVFDGYLERNAWQAATVHPDGSNLAMWGGTFRDEVANQIYGGSFSSDGTLFTSYFPTSNLADAAGFGGIRTLTRGPGRYEPVAGVTDRSGACLHASPAPSAAAESAAAAAAAPTGAAAGAAAAAAAAPSLMPAPAADCGMFAGPYVTEPEALPDGRLIVSVAADVAQDYGLYTMNADGSGLRPLFDVAGASELRARAIRPRPLPPVLADLFTRVPGARPPAGDRADDTDGTFVFDALNVYFNAPVDADIVSAPAIGSATTLRFFMDHQRASSGSHSSLDWPILLKALPISPGGAVRHEALPASLPLFEQARSAAGTVPLTGGPARDGAAHVSGMNFAPAGSVARCVGCHAGHTMIPVPASIDAAKWTNLAPGARIDVSSTRDASRNAGLIDRRAMKGEIARYWTAADGQQANQWAALTFPVPVKVKVVRLYNPRAGGEAGSTLAVREATVRLFSDEAGTRQIAMKRSGPLAVEGTDVTFPPTIVRMVRVDLDAVSGTFYGARTAGLAEIEVIASGDVK